MQLSCMVTAYPLAAKSRPAHCLKGHAKMTNQCSRSCSNQLLLCRLEGSNVTAYSLHPGIIFTPLYQHSYSLASLKGRILQTVMYPFSKSVPQVCLSYQLVMHDVQLLAMIATPTALQPPKA